MFKNLFKKDKQIEIKIATLTLIYKRIKRLYSILCRVNIKEDEKIKNIIRKNINTCDNLTHRCITFDFISNYGKRKINIGTQMFISPIPKNPYNIEFAYSFQYNMNKDNLFEINCLWHTTSVRPHLTPNYLTAHDIDMAIYEIEEYIRSKYGELEEIENYHKQQVDILEKGI